MDDDERELIERWKAGDRRAGDRLLDRHLDPLYRFFRNKVDAEVDELLQRTFLACVQSIDRFRGEGTFRSYVFAIARNELRQWFARRRRVRAHEVDLGTHSVVDLGTSPTSQLFRHQRQRELVHALRTLPVDLQIVIELHYWEGLTMEELAQVLEIAVGTVKSRIRRAREGLARALRQTIRLEVSGDAIDDWVRRIRDELEGGYPGST